MRPGRPSRHIKAKWIAWCKNGESTYYELDEKGNLIKSSDSDFIHVTCPKQSNEKKRRNKRKNEACNAESTPKKVQNPAKQIEKDNNTFDTLVGEPIQDIIKDENTLDFFRILDQLNDDSTLFDQLFEF